MNALNVLCAQLTHDLFAIVKFLLHLLLKGVVAVLTIRVRSIDVGDRGESVLATPVHPSSRRRQDVLVSCSRHRAAERRRHSASSVATPSLMSDSLSRHTQIC